MSSAAIPTMRKSDTKSRTVSLSFGGSSAGRCAKASCHCYCYSSYFLLLQVLLLLLITTSTTAATTTSQEMWTLGVPRPNSKGRSGHFEPKSTSRFRGFATLNKEPKPPSPQTPTLVNHKPQATGIADSHATASASP